MPQNTKIYFDILTIKYACLICEMHEIFWKQFTHMVHCMQYVIKVRIYATKHYPVVSSDITTVTFNILEIIIPNKFDH